MQDKSDVKFVSPGCKDNKCGTNVLSYLSLINTRQMLFKIDVIFSQRTNIRQTRQMFQTMKATLHKLRPQWNHLILSSLVFWVALPLVFRPFWVSILCATTGADVRVVDWVVSTLIPEVFLDFSLLLITSVYIKKNLWDQGRRLARSFWRSTK